ncbi:hypothetical protein LY04_02725 [Oceanimonas baumannii]|uniref:Uncharacterized protein n=1 Tax=Oceanimonas baumannii TaxID=129578 RepID=A0ABY2EWL1_9GAMM|nr:hypothetical protein LY04_02725 [Oceanimonas baumannii]
MRICRRNSVVNAEHHVLDSHLRGNDGLYRGSLIIRHLRAGAGPYVSADVTVSSMLSTTFWIPTFVGMTAYTAEAS